MNVAIKNHTYGTVTVLWGDYYLAKNIALNYGRINLKPHQPKAFDLNISEKYKSYVNKPLLLEHREARSTL